MWSLLVDKNDIPAGRHELTVRGINAAGRIFTDSRTVIQPDLTGNGLVDINDVLELLSQWGDCDCSGDLNGSGAVEVNDLLMLIAAWS